MSDYEVVKLDYRTIKRYDLLKVIKKKQFIKDFIGGVEVDTGKEEENYKTISFYDEIDNNNIKEEKTFADCFPTYKSLDGKKTLILLCRPMTKKDGKFINWYGADKEDFIKFVDLFGDKILTMKEFYDLKKSKKYIDYSLYEDDIYQQEPYIGERKSYKNSKTILAEIKQILKTKENLGLDDYSFLRKMLYGNTVATLETFLGDTFKEIILDGGEFFPKFINKYQFPKDKKFTISEIFQEASSSIQNIDDFLTYKVKSSLNEIIFHNLPKVKCLYKDILEVNIEEDLDFFIKAVENRHHIFHRNGKDLDGKNIDISKDILNEAIEKIETFIDDLYKVLP